VSHSALLARFPLRRVSSHAWIACRSGDAKMGVTLDGETLRSRRAKQGMTQAAVAESAGLTVRCYQNAERGTAVSMTTARAIATALECSFSSLF